MRLIDPSRRIEVLQTSLTDPARLHESVGPARDAPLGTGVTFYGMLHGLIQHDAYHAGQIVLLKRAIA